jgi:superfamily II DNA helicase RecQ
MTLRLVTVAFNPSTGAFPEDPLAGLEGELLSVVEHFFHYDGLPHLLLVCYLREPGETPAGKKDPQKHRQQEKQPDVRAELSPDERAIYERIRAWRQARAEADGLPPYALLTNRQAAEVARHAPRTLAALKEIKEIGVSAYSNLRRSGRSTDSSAEAARMKKPQAA